MDTLKQSVTGLAVMVGENPYGADDPSLFSTV